MPFDTRAAKLLQPGKYMLIADCPGLRLAACGKRHAQDLDVQVPGRANQANEAGCHRTLARHAGQRGHGAVARPARAT